MAYDEELATRIRELVSEEPGLSEQRMFGGLAFLIHGNMAVSASSAGGLLLRVPPEQTAELAARPHAQRFVMRGREMDGWLRVDADGLRTRSELKEWISLGVAHARRLPPKR
jgi:TfoX/Sxy family transcriptional regulator of competence genes